MRPLDSQESQAARSLPILARVPVGALVILAIWMVASLLNYAWLSADNTPPHWDYANHLLSAFNYRAALEGAASAGPLTTLKRLVHVDIYAYPPFFPLFASLVAPALSLRALVMTNCWFLGILLFSVFGIGRRVHGENAGVLAALLVAAYPICMQLSRQFMVDYALVSLTAASAYFLLASEDFRVPLATWLFGLTAALGMLTKPTFATFLVAPASYVLTRALRRALRPDAKQRDRRALVHLAGSLLMAVLLASLWYVPNWSGVRSEAVRIAASNPIGFPVSDANAIVYYLNILMVDQIGLPFFGLLVFGVLVLRKRVGGTEVRFLLWWLVGVYALASLSPYKGMGQDVGIVVPAAVISAVGLAGLTRFRRIATTATIVFSVAQTVVLSLPREVLADKVGTFRWAGSYQKFPDGADWKLEETLQWIGRAPRSVAVLSDDPRVNGNTIEFYRRTLGLPFKVFGRHDRSADLLLSSDVLIEKSGWTPEGTTRGATLEGVDTKGLGVMYTPGRFDASKRPDEPLANLLTRQDRELADQRERLGRNPRPFVRRFALPDGTDLIVSSSRPPAR